MHTSKRYSMFMGNATRKVQNHRKPNTMFPHFSLERARGGGGGGGRRGGAKKVEFANSVYLDEEPCCIQNGQNSKEFLAILSAIGLK